MYGKPLQFVPGKGKLQLHLWRVVLKLWEDEPTHYKLDEIT